MAGVPEPTNARVSVAVVEATRVASRPSLRCAFTAVVTITASLYKIASPVPAVGYWANHFKYVAARDSGDTSLGAPEVLDAVIRNTAVQGTLSIIFVVLAIIVITTSILATIRAYRNGGGSDSEDTPVASRVFAPAGLIATPAEKELEAQWAALEPGKRPARTGH